jgi:hypothetical protein
LATKKAPSKGKSAARSSGKGAPAFGPKAQAPAAPQGPRIIGQVRRSHVASSFGAGAVVDFRAPSGAPLSGLVAGLEEWDAAAPEGRKGLMHFQITTEPRLQKRLSVGGFRLPPVKDEKDGGWADVLPVVRFPRWLQCPSCERLKKADTFQHDPGRPERSCGYCSTGDHKVHAVPVRFIVACEDGHIDDFPWQRWINCRCSDPQLYLETVGAGLAGKLLRCKSAGCTSKPRSLEGVFSRNSLAPMGMKQCTGHRPWLPLSPEPCQQPPRVLQRGATTVYYAEVDSALDIPPFSMDLSTVVGPYWSDLKDLAEEQWPLFIQFNKLEEKTGKPREVLLRLLRDWKIALEAETADTPLEWAEYLQLLASEKGPVDQGEFQTRPEPVPPELYTFLNSVVLARRLREVRAHVGFTRVKPPSTAFKAPAHRMGRLYGKALSWLPAIELRGEGIFIRFNTTRMREWEQSEAVQQRVQELKARREKQPQDNEDEDVRTSPRFLLLHSFAHALMRQLALSCGYSSASLRERLYVGVEPREMAGVLIHTGSADSDGTLGGLVRQGREARLENTIREMLLASTWCSSDPLCITGVATLSSTDNLAACHACLLSPETSCQHFNLLLDRALLVGTPERPEVGYFNDLLAEISG